MELRVVTTEKGKILVDESAEIKKNINTVNEGLNGDWFYNSIYKSIARIGDITAYDFKIIATINHSISLDVSMVIVEDEVEKLALERYPNTHLISSSIPQIAIKAFIEGYKAAQQKGVYSEEDMEEAFQQGMDNVDNDGCYIDKIEIAFKECIEYLKQEYIELEMVENYDNDVSIYPNVLQIKTNRVDGQLMAYLKQ